MDFMYRYCIQLMAVLIPMVGIYYAFSWFIAALLPHELAHFFLDSLGFWFWVGPLCGLAFLIIFYARSWFKVKLYFLD